MGRIFDYPPLFKSGHLGGVDCTAPGAWGGGEGRGATWLRAASVQQTLPELRWADSQVATSTGILGKISRQFDPIPFSLSFLFPFLPPGRF